MNLETDNLFDDVIQAYEAREPDGSDTWNPLGKQKELWHRIRLLVAIDWALRQMSVPIHDLKVLDVGCGVGRSTRALLEFGVKPENVMGIDLRPSAIHYAMRVNPAIQFRTVQNFADWPSANSFHLCMQCTVFSSIEGNERRLLLAQMMQKMIVKEGYIFWWDLLHANHFAGGDLLDPRGLFEGSSLLSKTEVSLRPSVDEAVKRRNSLFSLFTKGLQRYFGHFPTHLMAIFQGR